MIWGLLVALGIPIWLVVGALLGALWSRHTHRSAPGVFPCKVRTISSAVGPVKWTRRTTYARWVHDVLLVHSGMALVRYQALPVRSIDDPIAPAPGVKVRGGDDPVAVRMTIDDGSQLEVASLASAAELLTGPFYAPHAKPAASASP
jgi:hypothetical protein